MYFRSRWERGDSNIGLWIQGLAIDQTPVLGLAGGGESIPKEDHPDDDHEQTTTQGEFRCGASEAGLKYHEHHSLIPIYM